MKRNHKAEEYDSAPSAELGLVIRGSTRRVNLPMMHQGSRPMYRSRRREGSEEAGNGNVQSIRPSGSVSTSCIHRAAELLLILPLPRKGRRPLLIS